MKDLLVYFCILAMVHLEIPEHRVLPPILMRVALITMSPSGILGSSCGLSSGRSPFAASLSCSLALSKLHFRVSAFPVAITFACSAERYFSFPLSAAMRCPQTTDSSNILLNRHSPKERKAGVKVRSDNNHLGEEGEPSNHDGNLKAIHRLTNEMKIGNIFTKIFDGANNIVHLLF